MQGGVSHPAPILLPWAEPGAERAQAVLDRSSVSAVNWSEVLHKSIDRGVDIAGMTDDLLALGVAVEPFTLDDSERPRAFGRRRGPPGSRWGTGPACRWPSGSGARPSRPTGGGGGSPPASPST